MSAFIWWQELAEREIDLLERELNMMMIQQERAAAAAAPTPKKRKGKFKKSRLRLLKKDGGHHISMPTGNTHWTCSFVLRAFYLVCRTVSSSCVARNFPACMRCVPDCVHLCECVCVVFICFSFLDFRHNITIQLTPSRAELNRLQVQIQNGLYLCRRGVLLS